MADPLSLSFHGVRFEIAPQPDLPTYMVLGIRKSGSSIFNNICAALAKFNGVQYVDVGGAFFAAGVRENVWQTDPSVAGILHPGILYGGFRSFPTALSRTDAYRAAMKVCMVRDPRDAMVSEYFSNAYSHSLPKAGEALEDFKAERARALRSELTDYVATRIPQMAATCAPFVAAAEDPRTRIFRYEDVIFEKPQLMRDVCAHFGWTVTDAQIGLIMGWADVRPDAERPGEFVRRVAPGDYLDKMPPDLQSRVANDLAPFMAAFDYR